MRYIRTKDGIEKVPNDYANKLVECPNLIIADTIEELCDEFVLVSKDGKNHLWYIAVEDKIYVATKYGTVPYPKEELMQNCDLIGAIWTYKGLIYVAKMNDKGELELL